MHQVGYTSGIDEDESRPNWDGNAARPLAWSAWYPAQPSAGDRLRPTGQFFDLGEVQLDAELNNEATFPVALMSHGTGGSAEGLGWLARSLAQRGYVVIGAQHHGNTAKEPYRPEGFLCWWERAADLSTLLSLMNERDLFAGRLDFGDVSAVGFSLGAYTVLATAGAITSMKRYIEWSTALGRFTTGPRELPDAANHIQHLMETSEPFRTSWARQSDSFVDARIQSVIAIAPPPPVRAFNEESLQSIRIPVTLITGEADEEAPSPHCADWLKQVNPSFQRISVGENVGHYTFLGFPAGIVPETESFLFADHPSVSRADIHDATANRVLAVLRQR